MLWSDPAVWFQELVANWNETIFIKIDLQRQVYLWPKWNLCFYRNEHKRRWPRVNEWSRQCQQKTRNGLKPPRSLNFLHSMLKKAATVRNQYLKLLSKFTYPRPAVSRREGRSWAFSWSLFCPAVVDSGIQKRPYRQSPFGQLGGVSRLSNRLANLLEDKNEERSDRCFRYLLCPSACDWSDVTSSAAGCPIAKIESNGARFDMPWSRESPFLFTH